MQVICPDCDTLCSRSAFTCPKCGHPFRVATVRTRGGAGILTIMLGIILAFGFMAIFPAIVCVSVPLVGVGIVQSGSGFDTYEAERRRQKQKKIYLRNKLNRASNPVEPPAALAEIVPLTSTYDEACKAWNRRKRFKARVFDRFNDMPAAARAANVADYCLSRREPERKPCLDCLAAYTASLKRPILPPSSAGL